MRIRMLLLAGVAILVGCGEVVKDDATPDAAAVCGPNVDCNDNNQCTTDTCAPTSGCRHVPLSCDDSDSCTIDSCEPATGCVNTSTAAAGSQMFDYTGALQTFTVPTCVTQVRLTAAGAQGGSALITPPQLGGRGASLAGDFTVAPGQTLTILVGGSGRDAITTDPGQRGGSGGGGTYVVSGTTIHVVAGGGGGATGYAGIGEAPGGPGQITTNGQPGLPGNVAAGVNGGGGTTFSNAGGYHGGTGGGGYSGNGINDGDGSVTNYGAPTTRGLAFVNGGAGGTGGAQGRPGGFGGGGGAGFTGGGGGGYSGGGAGGPVSGTGTAYTGGGGGSINTGTNPDNQAGVRMGNGQVVITW